MNKLLVLLSGGVDSTVLLHQLHAGGHDVIALTLKHAHNTIEVERAIAIAKALQVPHEVIDFTALGDALKVDNYMFAVGGEMGGCVPGQKRQAPMSVPTMLSFATSYAITHGYNSVAWALHADDLAHISVPVERMVKAIEMIATIEGATCQIIMPLSELTKVDVVKVGLELQAPIADTFSCVDPIDGNACKTCTQCVARRMALGSLLQAEAPVTHMIAH